MHDVISIDDTTISGLQSIQKQLFKNDQSLIFVGASTETIVALQRSGLRKIKGK